MATPTGARAPSRDDVRFMCPSDAPAAHPAPRRRSPSSIHPQPAPSPPPHSSCRAAATAANHVTALGAGPSAPRPRVLLEHPPIAVVASRTLHRGRRVEVRGV